MTKRKLTEEHKRKLSESHKGIKYPPRSKEWRENMSRVHKGKIVSEETRKKISIARKGKYAGKNHPQWGKKRPDEWNKKHSEIMKERFPPGPTHFNFGKRHSRETKEKMRKAKLGKYRMEKNNRWKGGIWHHTKGYIFIFNRYHPFCDSRNYVAEHRLVIEKQIGRYLKPKEACHHINKIKDDNRPENLMAFKTQAAHNSFEASHPINSSDVIFDGRKL